MAVERYLKAGRLEGLGTKEVTKFKTAGGNRVFAEENREFRKAVEERTVHTLIKRKQKMEFLF